ncbi:MAG: hypothetical protein H6Q72_3898 [Firmicutes bacterium]|nr:hypothetical protein [Bacillota bacterium]
MVMVYTPGKKYECAEVSRIHLKMLIDENGQEYLLVYDLGQEYLFAATRGEGERLDFTLIDEVVQVEEEMQFGRIGVIGLTN